MSELIKLHLKLGNEEKGRLNMFKFTVLFTCIAIFAVVALVSGLFDYPDVSPTVVMEFILLVMFTFILALIVEIK